MTGTVTGGVYTVVVGAAVVGGVVVGALADDELVVGTRAGTGVVAGGSPGTTVVVGRVVDASPRALVEEFFDPFVALVVDEGFLSARAAIGGVVTGTVLVEVTAYAVRATSVK